MQRARLDRAGAQPAPARSKSILNDRLIKQFCALVERGLPPDGVCDYLGIAPSTFWQWMKKGEMFLVGDGEPKGHAIFAQFVTAFRRSSASYRLDRIEKLHTQPGQAWIRELAILERRDRRNFARNDQPGGNMEAYDPDERFL